MNFKKYIGICLVIFLLSVGKGLAQVPQGITYQALATDNEGVAIAEKGVSVRVSIIASAIDRPPLYIEYHDLLTNEVGLFTLIIGEGSASLGDFAKIDWTEAQYYVGIELAIEDRRTFYHMGTSRLYTVPFAFHAQSVSDKDDADADPLNEIQALTRIGDSLFLTKSPPIRLPDYTDKIGALIDSIHTEKARATEAEDDLKAKDLALIDSIQTETERATEAEDDLRATDLALIDSIQTETARATAAEDDLRATDLALIDSIQTETGARYCG